MKLSMIQNILRRSKIVQNLLHFKLIIIIDFYAPRMFVMNCGKLEVIERKYLAHGGFMLHGGPSSSIDNLSI